MHAFVRIYVAQASLSPARSHAENQQQAEGTRMNERTVDEVAERSHWHASQFHERIRGVPPRATHIY